MAIHTELILLIISILFFISIIADKAGYKFGVPTLLLFLAVGMIFGSDGFGIQFANIQATQVIGTIALGIILFSGGLDTKINEIRPIMWQGVMLATVGVLLTTLITGFLIWWIFGVTEHLVTVSLTTSLLIAAIMSSTDSASVFSIFGSKNLNLKNNLRPILELESGSNDPMAYVIVITLIDILKSGSEPNLMMIFWNVFVQLAIGAALGYALGKFAVYVINRLDIYNQSLYPILVFTLCIFVLSVTYFLKGNGFLAVYIAGLVMGNSKFVHKRSSLKFLDGLAWISQLLMFLTLGLLVNPKELLTVIVPGLIISILIIFVARPLSVFVSMLPFRRMSIRDKTYISWVGLRGAVPIIFALFPLADNVPNSELIFNLVFFCTLLSLILQGTTLTHLAQWLHLADNSRVENKLENFDIEFSDEIKSVTREININQEHLANGNRIMDLSFPEKTLIVMIKRADKFFVPTGKTQLRKNDKLLILTDNNEVLEETFKNLGIDSKSVSKPETD